MLELAPTKPGCVDFQMGSADGAEICWLASKVSFISPTPRTSLPVILEKQNKCIVFKHGILAPERWGRGLGLQVPFAGGIWGVLCCPCCSCCANALHLPSVPNPALQGAGTEKLWQILPQKLKIFIRVPKCCVLSG